ncbi:MAG: hypothetical protein ACXAAQ_17115 [Candidatus Thorarchaeota archaeon]
MHQRLKVLIVVALTFIITLSGGFLTESFRQSITFSWAIEVGDEFIYDVSVIGNTTTGTQVLPPPLEPMNNTRIIVEVTSLPIYYPHIFIQEVVEHPKTTSRFDDDSTIPAEFYYAINSHALWSILPIGAWGHLDSMFPDQVNWAIPDYASYFARSSPEFIFGYWSNETGSKSEWHGIMDLATGVPSVISFSVWSEGQPWSYFYNVTMTLDN